MSALVRQARAHLARPGSHRAVRALLVSAAAIGAVTGLVYLLQGLAPVLSLGALYVLAVLPVAVLFGRAWALTVAIGSLLVFNFVFIPPTMSLTLHGGENWLVFAVYVVTGLLVSDLAARARRRAREAEQREREAALLAELSTTLLSGAAVEPELPRIAAATARVLATPSARIELGGVDRPLHGESAHELTAGDRRIGTLFLPGGSEPDPGVSSRFLPALTSVLAIAIDRERLAHEALETEALRRSDALKTSLLRAVSHDLRSPLTAIRASLEALESPLLTLDTAHRAALVHSALVEAGRLDRMVRNLLDLSRLEAGASPPAARTRTVEALVDQALAQLPPGERRVQVVLSPGLPLVLADPAQAERVLVNLLENALKYSPPASPVDVRVGASNAEVLIRVVDRGPGITRIERERVFQPFHRGPTSRARGGAGLGLAIARGFAEANGGRVWAEEAEGGGAVFVLALPAAREPAGAAA